MMIELYVFIAVAAFVLCGVAWIVHANKKKSPEKTLEKIPEKPAVRVAGAPVEKTAEKVAEKFTDNRGAAVSEAVSGVATEVVRPAAATPAKSLNDSLSSTKASFLGRIKAVFGAKERLSAGELEELEEVLYTSDLGPATVQRLMAAVETKLKSEGASGLEVVRLALREEMLGILTSVENGSRGKAELERLNIWSAKPAVLMIVGVNGAGKTTTIGKLARKAATSGKKVLVAAGDTFRAAAAGQLKVWTERAQVEIFDPAGVQDPSAVAFEACQKAKSEGFDLVIVDTAGRLHTQKNLMEELKKMKRVIAKVIPEGPHEILLVLDANSGQNALIQAREFHAALEVTGVALTKLDGTAKGGVAIGLANELHIPIKMIGIGEGVEDLRAFSSEEFVDSII